MDSRQFIKTAAQLVQRIKDQALMEDIRSTDESREEGQAIQKAVSNAFQGLQNPTLPSAYKLCDVALGNGYFVDPKVQHRLNQGESCWGN